MGESLRTFPTCLLLSFCDQEVGDLPLEFESIQKDAQMAELQPDLLYKSWVSWTVLMMTSFNGY